MKEEIKYYTPKIEEFHVGFEFEIWETHSKLYNRNIDDSKWVRKTYDLRSIGFEKLYTRLFEKDVRVKYLDREDIESLGWVHEEDNLFSFKSEEVTYYLILYTQFDNKIEIRCTNPSVSYGNFLGNCKNKSELKRVMEQLTILKTNE